MSIMETTAISVRSSFIKSAVYNEDKNASALK